MTVAVCWKWVAVDGDERYGGVSEADRAALEVALQLAGAREDHVTVLALGPPGADAALREALAVGARLAVRIDAPTALRSDRVAASLAAAISAVDAAWVCCGDASPDRGSGSVPATIAAILDRPQALGLVAIDAGADGAVRAVRRLDGGRREELAVQPPAVLSVEGSVARLRRASLPAELAARTASIDVVAGPSEPCDEPSDVRAFRPRARVLPPPDGASALDRVRALTAAGAAGAHGELVVLDPPAGAARIVAALTEWGYLDGSHVGGEQDLARRHG